MKDFTVEVNKGENKQTGEAVFSKVESTVKAPNNLVKPFTVPSVQEKRQSNGDEGIKEEKSVEDGLTPKKNQTLTKPFRLGSDLSKEAVHSDNLDVNVISVAQSESTSDTTNALQKSDRFDTTERSEVVRDEHISSQAPSFGVKPVMLISDINAIRAKQLAEDLNVSYKIRPVLEHCIARTLEENPQLANLLPDTAAKEFYRKTGMNFTMQLIGVQIAIKDTENGEQENRSYQLNLTVTKLNGKQCLFTTTVEDYKIKGTDWLRKATGSLAHIPADKTEKEIFANMVQKCIETEEIPVEIEYPNAGWRQVPNLGWRYIFKEGIIGGAKQKIHTAGNSYSLNVNLPEVGKSDVFSAAMNMTELCKHKAVSTTLVLYVHASLLTTLFEIAGYPLCFVYIIQGVTNSRKTSLVTAVGKLFDREKLIADAEFATATSCGIEKTASLYKDAPVLIDDFKPGATLAQQREMERKLDELIRLYGNRVSKKRMNDYSPKGNEKFFPVGGGCILTAEILTGVSSTLTRAFVTEIDRNDVQNDLLEYYQNQRWILPTHMYDFLLWATGEFDRIVGFICQRFPVLRKQCDFQYNRYSEMFATFYLTAELLGQYAVARGFWNMENASAFEKMVDEYLLEILYANEDNMSRRDKGRWVLEVLEMAVESGQIVPVELNERTSSQKHDCYEDGEYFYIRYQALKQLADRRLGMLNKSFGIYSDDELFMLLENLDVLEVEERNGRRNRSRKLPIQRGNALRYLYIKKERMCQLMTEK